MQKARERNKWSSSVTTEKKIEVRPKLESCCVESFGPRSDQDIISPYKINIMSSKQVMRIEKKSRSVIFMWYNIKFSELRLLEMYDQQ